jgi:hypothetical protein
MPFFPFLRINTLGLNPLHPVLGWKIPNWRNRTMAIFRIRLGFLLACLLVFPFLGVSNAHADGGSAQVNLALIVPPNGDNMMIDFNTQQFRSSAALKYISDTNIPLIQKNEDGLSYKVWISI